MCGKVIGHEMGLAGTLYAGRVDVKCSVCRGIATKIHTSILLGEYHLTPKQTHFSRRDFNTLGKFSLKYILFSQSMFFSELLIH